MNAAANAHPAGAAPAPEAARPSPADRGGRATGAGATPAAGDGPDPGGAEAVVVAQTLDRIYGGTP